MLFKFIFSLVFLVLLEEHSNLSTSWTQPTCPHDSTWHGRPSHDHTGGTNVYGQVCAAGRTFYTEGAYLAVNLVPAAHTSLIFGNFVVVFLFILSIVFF